MSRPSAPRRPEVSPASPSSLRVSWERPRDDSEVSRYALKVRITGSQRAGEFYNHATGRLVRKGGEPVPESVTEVTIEGLEEGLAYEVAVAAGIDNAPNDWSDLSHFSEPVALGALKSRDKPRAPAAPTLAAVGASKLRCSWTIPEAFPPVEATRVQITDVAQGFVFTIDGRGTLVPNGRTNFPVPRCEVNITGADLSVEYVATVSCCNADGFGEYSMASDPVALAGDASGGMALVLHHGPTAEVPVMDALGDGKMRVRWVLPDGAKFTTVKVRRAGDSNWRVCGGTVVPAPATETIANGIEEGIEYEAMVEFMVSGRHCESLVSQPACIGCKKQPGIPEAPEEPLLLVLDQGANRGQMRVKWKPFTAVPPLTGCLVKFRAVGARAWQYVQPTGQVVDEEPEPVQTALADSLDVVDLQPGVRYETVVAFRNKLGQGPFSLPSIDRCIGRPVPRYFHCMNCLQEYDLKHGEYTKNLDSFYCLVCRFRLMDPFNAVVEPSGFVFLHLVSRPQMTFKIDIPDLKAWRREDHAFFLRMTRINSVNCAQVWPKKLTLTANGNEVILIKAPEEGHVRRDIPKDIAAGLKPGINEITIVIEDDYVAGYAMALAHTQTRNAQQIARDTPRCGDEAAKARVMTLLADTWATPPDNGEEEEEITCVISNKLKLRCPLSFERVVVPARGEQCMHLQCFGLAAYLESNMKMRAMNNRWTCPACGNVLRPQDLRVDAYVEHVLEETAAHVEEVTILPDGSYRCEEEAPEAAAAAAAREREAAAAAAAAVGLEERQREGEVTEMYQTIGDGDAERRKRPLLAAPLTRPLTRRQKRQRQKLLSAEAGSDNDSD